MPLGRRVFKVLVRRPPVQDVLVVQELDLADLHDHVHLQAGAGCFDDVGGFELGGGEGGDEAGRGEAGRGAEEVGVESFLGGGGVRGLVWGGCSWRGFEESDGGLGRRIVGVIVGIGTHLANIRSLLPFGSRKKTLVWVHCSWPLLTSPLRSKYQMGSISVFRTSGRSFRSVLYR